MPVQARVQALVRGCELVADHKQSENAADGRPEGVFLDAQSGEGS